MSRLFTTKLLSVRGFHAFRERFVTYAWQMARRGTTWRVTLPSWQTSCQPLKYHDLARNIAERCGNKIHASVRLA